MSTTPPKENKHILEQKTVHCDNCGETNNGVRLNFKMGRYQGENVEYWNSGQSKKTTTFFTDIQTLPVELCGNCLQESFVEKLKKEKKDAIIHLAIVVFGLLPFTIYQIIEETGMGWFMVLLFAIFLINGYVKLVHSVKPVTKRVDSLLLKGEDFHWFERYVMKDLAEKKIATTKHTHVFTQEEYSKMKYKV